MLVFGNLYFTSLVLSIVPEEEGDKERRKWGQGNRGPGDPEGRGQGCWQGNQGDQGEETDQQSNPFQWL